MIELYRGNGQCVHNFSPWGVCFDCNTTESDEPGLNYGEVMKAEEKGGARAIEALIFKRMTCEARNNLIVYNKKMEWQWLEVDATCLLGLEDASYAGVIDYIWDWPFLLRPNMTDFATFMTELTPTAKMWLRWLANDSLYAPAFVTKRFHDMFKRGVLYNAWGVPCRVLISAMCGVRYVGEVPHIPEMWRKWLPYVGTPHEALYLAHCTEFNEDGQVMTFLNSYNHSMWDVTSSLFGKYEFTKLVKGKFIRTPTINTAHTWPDLCRQFGLRQPTPEIQWPPEKWMSMKDWRNEFWRINK